VHLQKQTKNENKHKRKSNTKTNKMKKADCNFCVVERSARPLGNFVDVKFC